MTATAQPQGWSLNIEVTEIVRRRALNDADRRDLLEHLGLVKPGSNVCEPDDTRPMESNSGASINKMAAKNRGQGDRERPDSGARMTTPPGLANLPPLPEETKPAKRTRKAAS